MESSPRKRETSASPLGLLAAPMAAVLLHVAGCVDITPPWEKVRATGGSGGLDAGGGATGQSPDGPGATGGLAEAGAGGSIDLGVAGAGGVVDGAVGALDTPWAGVAGAIDAGPGGVEAGGLGGSISDAPVAATGGAAGRLDGGFDIPVGSAGGTTDGASTTGGVPGRGTSGAGGTVATGGTSMSGGVTSTGGATGTGGVIGTGGATTKGGTSGTGGATSTGGTSGTGGARAPDGGATLDTRSGPDANPVLTGLVVYYTFESANGTSVPDLSGKGNNGTLGSDVLPDGGAPPDPGYELVASKAGLGNALSLRKAGLGYVRVPTGVFANTTDLTIAMWVNVTTPQSWQRLVDVGIDAKIPQNTNTGTKYMNIVPQGSDSTASNMLFRISKDGFDNEQKLTGPSVPTGTWTHVALVLAAGGGGKLYIDGVEKDSQTSVTLRAVDLGAIDYAFIGKTPFSATPPFDGMVDEFRVYNRALSAAEVTALFNFNGW